jgi:hypothetical protein
MASLRALKTIPARIIDARSEIIAASYYILRIVLPTLSLLTNLIPDKNE